jgi:hypothetical protein
MLTNKEGWLMLSCRKRDQIEVSKNMDTDALLKKQLQSWTNRVPLSGWEGVYLTYTMWAEVAHEMTTTFFVTVV